MAFYWRYQTPHGIPDGAPEEEFDDQAEAEAWFSDTWENLRAQGVESVVLMDGEDKVYGPMSLDESS